MDVCYEHVSWVPIILPIILGWRPTTTQYEASTHGENEDCSGEGEHCSGG